jgi:hypothetical protein
MFVAVACAAHADYDLRRQCDSGQVYGAQYPGSRFPLLPCSPGP